MARHILNVVAVMVAFAIVGHLAYQAAASPNSGADTKSSRTCFSAADWNGGTTPDRYRPCVAITRLYEDGSFKYAVSDASGTVRYSGGVGAQDR